MLIKVSHPPFVLSLSLSNGECTILLSFTISLWDAWSSVWLFLLVLIPIQCSLCFALSNTHRPSYHSINHVIFQRTTESVLCSWPTGAEHLQGHFGVTARLLSSFHTRRKKKWMKLKHFLSLFEKKGFIVKRNITAAQASKQILMKQIPVFLWHLLISLRELQTSVLEAFPRGSHSFQESFSSAVSIRSWQRITKTSQALEPEYCKIEDLL